VSKATLTQADVLAILQKVGDDLTAQADKLRELDAAIGDGDLGITVTLGFAAVCEGLPALAQSDIGTILTKSGMAFNRKAASTFGALFATMLIRAGQLAKGLMELGASQITAMLDAALKGAQERGKAQLGDKTLLDALAPAAQAASTLLAESPDASAGALLQEAARAAEEGAAATTLLQSRAGRAGWFGERTVGVQDPGATAVAMMLRSASEYVTELDAG
jgi:dihydroxyacetone kinase-like protein